MHIAYVNGQYVYRAQALVSAEDRGYQFADGVYEYIAVHNSVLIDEQAHIERLYRSLTKIRIAFSITPRALHNIMRELIAQNRCSEGGLYLQITRGAAKRDHLFPASAKPVLTATLHGCKIPPQHILEKGASVITHPDARWQHCDIKSISLLPNILAKQAAAEKGAREAWLMRDGVITEGSASNAYIVVGGEIITHPANAHILDGVVRRALQSLAHKNNIAFIERAFTLQQALSADEAFITSTSAGIVPISIIDGKTIGKGACGAITQKLMALYSDHVKEQSGKAWTS